MSGKLKTARVSVQSVRVECPHCGSALMNPEGKDGHSFVVFTEAGEVRCPSCREAFELPDLSDAFKPIRLRRSQ